MYLRWVKPKPFPERVYAGKTYEVDPDTGLLLDRVTGSDIERLRTLENYEVVSDADAERIMRARKQEAPSDQEVFEYLREMARSAAGLERFKAWARELIPVNHEEKQTVSGKKHGKKKGK